MLVDNRFTRPPRNGTLIGVGMKQYAYAYTTQMAKFAAGLKKFCIGKIENCSKIEN